MKQHVFNFCLGLTLAVWAGVMALVIMLVAGFNLGDDGFTLCFTAALIFSGLAILIFARVAFDERYAAKRRVDRELALHHNVFPRLVIGDPDLQDELDASA